MHIIIKSDEELLQMFKEAVHILNNLRTWEKYWNEHYGYEARQAKKKWQDKADEFLLAIDATKTRRVGEVHIKLESHE